MSVEVQLKTHAERVDQRLSELLPSADSFPPQLHEAMRYSALAPGKRLRPALVLASCEAVSESSESALDAACAVEMVHAFSLIHDDLPAIDNDELRRGRPTCHVQYGEAVALLAGDALFALAFEVLARSLPMSYAVEGVSLLSKASISLVRGETADVLGEGKPIDEVTLRFIHANKTGALIAASCELGALAGSGTPQAIQALRSYGQEIGLAFQIADDILNETATPEQLGKAAGSDRERQKATYPALYGLEKSRQLALAAVDRGIASLNGLRGDTSLLCDLATFSVERLR